MPVIVRPAGKLLERVMPVKATALLLVIVTVRVDVPPALIVEGLKEAAMVGGAGAVMVSFKMADVLPLKLLSPL